MPRVHQYIDPGEIASSAQKGFDQCRPVRDLGFCSGGIAVARHVHNVQVAGAGEENEFLRAPGCTREAYEVLATGERVDKARLAGVRTARKGDFDALHGWKRDGRGGGGNELPIAGKKLAAGFDLRAGET